MAEIAIHLANSGINVEQLLLLYKDFNKINQILTNKPIVSAIEDLLKIWQRNQRFLAPICTSAYGCIAKLLIDTEFRDDVLAKIEFCTKWVWKQIIVKSAKELLVRCNGFWTSLKDIIKQKLISDKDIKIKNELEVIEQKIERLREILIELEDLIVQFEENEDTIKNGQLSDAIDIKINQVLQVEVIEIIDELKEFIIKYQEKEKIERKGLGFTTAVSAIGLISAFLNPPSYFLTTLAYQGSIFVFSSLAFNCTADKVKELSQQLTRLEAYKREYENTMQEISRLSQKKDQIASKKLIKLVAVENLNTNKNEGCKCGGCKCQQV